MEIMETAKGAVCWIFGTRSKVPVAMIKTMLPIRGLAILLVVLAHAVIMMLAAQTNIVPGEHLSPVLWGIWRISALPKSVTLELCACAVPIFLFLSGFYSLSSPQTWKAIWSNVKKLLLPMITWSLVAWAFSWRKGSGGWTATQFVGLFISGRTQTGYFFIILITQFYILTKWLVPAAKKNPGAMLALSALMQLATHAYDYAFLLSQMKVIAPIGWVLSAGPFPEFLFPRFMLSFALGIWASQSIASFRKIIHDRFWVVIVGAAAMAAILILERGVIFQRAYAGLGMSEFEATSISWVGWKASTALWTIAAIFLTFGWFQRSIPMKSLLDLLGKYSFQIFILHGMVLDLIRPAMYKLFAGEAFYGFAGVALLLVSGLIGPVLLTKLIQRWAPRGLRMFLLGA
jgi:fucose 4-O-acetylase-like acetyltransferase